MAKSACCVGSRSGSETTRDSGSDVPEETSEQGRRRFEHGCSGWTIELSEQESRSLISAVRMKTRVARALRLRAEDQQTTDHSSAHVPHGAAGCSKRLFFSSLA